MALRIITAIILLTTQVHAQDYLTEATKWYSLRGDILERWYTESVLEVGEDTLINGQTYKIIHSRGSYLEFYLVGTDTLLHIPEETNVAGYLRQEGNKLYRWWSGADRLVIDFDYQIGDPIENGQFAFEVIERIDTMLFDGEPRRVFTTNYERKIFEGIGTTQGLFEGLSYIGDEAFGALKCYYRNGNIYDLYDGWIPEEMTVEDCAEVFLVTDTYEPNALEDDIYIYPNPVLNNLWVEVGHSTGGEAIITNALGEEQFRVELPNTHRFEIDFQTLKSGVYFIKLRIGAREYSKKIIKN